VSKQISQNAIGRALGLSSANMVKMKKQGCPMDSVESARAWREKHQNIAARKAEPDGKPATALGIASPAKAPGVTVAQVPVIKANEVKADGTELDESHDAARTRREIAEANLAEMKEAEQRGELIRIAAIKSTLSVVFATTRDALLQIPARMAPLLAADADPASVQNILHGEIHRVLHDLAGAPDRLGQLESEPA
jgi:hypothetical protein